MDRAVERLQSAIDAAEATSDEQGSPAMEEWEVRTRGAARRLLSGVVYREMSHITWEAVGSPSLPTIGYYYSMFHASAALLAFEPAVESRKLRGLKHEFVGGQIRQHFVDKGLLSEDYGALMQELRASRNAVNYAVGGKLLEDDLVRELDGELAYARTGVAFAEAVAHLRTLTGRVMLGRGGISVLDRIRTSIGDDIGDDLLALHVPREHRDRVWKYLVDHDLTT